MGGDFETRSPKWDWQRDPSGFPIAPDLAHAAERIWTRVLAYSRLHGQDSARAADVLESLLLTVSRARRRNTKRGRPIRSSENYLYIAFVKNLNREISKEPPIDSVGSVHDLEILTRTLRLPVSRSLDKDILVKQLMSYMNERTRRTYTLRHMGHSWNDVARMFRKTANNAHALFNYGLKMVQRRVMKAKGPQNTSGKGGGTNE
jgi:hypothetical protein